MNFVVRVWTLQANYWDVYWDLIRAVKLRFDAEGIKIPFPQRELHVNMPRDLQGENNGSPTAAESKQNQLS